MKQPIPIVVLDGTYIYIHKSEEYAFQEMSFSMHFDVAQKTHKYMCVCIHASLMRATIT